MKTYRGKEMIYISKKHLMAQRNL